MAKAKSPATERIVRYSASTKGYWVIPSEKGDILLARSLLPRMNQEDAARYSSPEGFHASSLSEYFDVFAALYELRNKGEEVENARQFIRGNMIKYQLATLTKLKYNPKGKDIIIHNYGNKSRKVIRANVLGSNGLLSEVLSLETSLALIGKSPEEAEEIMKYITESPFYICMPDSKPEFIDERVPMFYENSGWAVLDCDGHPSLRYDGLGVRYTQEAHAPKK